MDKGMPQRNSCQVWSQKFAIFFNLLLFALLLPMSLVHSFSMAPLVHTERSYTDRIRPLSLLLPHGSIVGPVSPLLEHGSFQSRRCGGGVMQLYSSPSSTFATGLDFDESLKGCVCVVTGASRGIGKGIAIALGKKGATVYVTGTSSSSSSAKTKGPYVTDSQVGGPGTVQETASLVTQLGGTGIAVVCNHANDDDVKRLFQQVNNEQGRLDILVNNVFRIPPGGLNKLMGKFWEQGVDAWDALHTVGLRSHFVASSLAMPLMLESRDAKYIPRPFIAMISSFGGLSYTFSVPYGVGKAGVDRLAKDMAVELRQEDICVTSFYPGLVQTERTDIAVENGDWDEYVGIPLDNSETPEFTGRAVVAVATDSNNMAKSGTFQVVAELADEYGFDDINGKRPPSIRSFKFLIPTYGMDEETREKVPDWLIPDWKLPFWVMAGGKPPDRE